MNINITKQKAEVINIKSEILFREAEDDLFFFNNPSLALKKLKNAIALTPGHKKSHIFAGHICFLKGFINKALEHYLKAEKISSHDAKVQAAVANCFKSSGNTEKALVYIDKALQNTDENNILLYVQLLEMKTEILISKNKYSQAYSVLSDLKNTIDNKEFDLNTEFDFKFLSDKIELGRKLENSDLKVI